VEPPDGNLIEFHDAQQYQYQWHVFDKISMCPYGPFQDRFAAIAQTHFLGTTPPDNHNGKTEKQ
jgi:hypothetical protein